MLGLLLTVFLVAPVLGWPQLVVPPLEKISVKGTFMCGNNTANGYKVDLFEEDLMFDDLLTTKFTDHNGHLYISATDSEFGGIKTYIEIYNRCFNGETKEGCVRYTKVHIPKEMANKEYELPVMDLNIIRPNEDVPECGRPPKTTTRRQSSTSVQTTVSPIVPDVTRPISRVPSTRSEVVVSTTQSTTSEQATTVVTSEATSIVTSGPTTVVTPEATTIVTSGPSTTEKETIFVTSEATRIVTSGPTTTKKETTVVTSEAPITNPEKTAEESTKTTVTSEATTAKSESTTAMPKKTEPITSGAPVVNDKVEPVKPEGSGTHSEASPLKTDSKASKVEEPNTVKKQGASEPPTNAETRSMRTDTEASEESKREQQIPNVDSEQSTDELEQPPQFPELEEDSSQVDQTNKQ